MVDGFVYISSHSCQAAAGRRLLESILLGHFNE